MKKGKEKNKVKEIKYVEAVSKKTVQLWREVWRQRWMLLFPIMFGWARLEAWLDPNNPLTVALGKGFGICLGLLVGVVFLQQYFDYYKMGAYLNEALSPANSYETRMINIIAFCGGCVLRGLVLGACVLGASWAVGV